MADMKRKQMFDLSGGMQNRTVEAMARANQLWRAHNAEFDSKIGAVTGRKGSLVLSTVGSTVVDNLGIYTGAVGATRQFFGGSNSGIIYKNGSANFEGTWSSSLTLTAAKQNFFENFAKKLIVANGTDAPRWYDGSTWATITNAPATGKFPVIFNQRLYLFGEDCFLHYSDAINSTGDGFSSTSWLNRGINPNDGQKGMGAVRHRGRIVLFKEESIYRFNGANEPEATITIGTSSSKSIVINGSVFFFHPSGIQKMDAGEPVNISRGVQKYISGMDSANWDKVAGGRDLENIYMWIGDVTINDPREADYGESFTNVVLAYNVFSQTWKAYTNWNARTWFYDEVTREAFFVTSAGKITKINTAYADVDGATTTPIDFDIVLTPDDFGYPEKYKHVGQVFLLGTYSAEVKAGESYVKMRSMDKMQDEEGLINEEMVFKTLWVGANEMYNDIPPQITGFICDQLKIDNDNK